MQPPGFNAEEELGTDIVEKLRSGKGEKKRYFVLVRAKVPMKDQQAATLSWYQHKPEGTFFGAGIIKWRVVTERYRSLQEEKAAREYHFCAFTLGAPRGQYLDRVVHRR